MPCASATSGFACMAAQAAACPGAQRQAKHAAAQAKSRSQQGAALVNGGGAEARQLRARQVRRAARALWQLRVVVHHPALQQGLHCRGNQGGARRGGRAREGRARRRRRAWPCVSAGLGSAAAARPAPHAPRSWPSPAAAAAWAPHGCRKTCAGVGQRRGGQRAAWGAGDGGGGAAGDEAARCARPPPPRRTSSTRGSPASRLQRSRAAVAAGSTSATSKLNCRACTGIGRGC